MRLPGRFLVLVLVSRRQNDEPPYVSLGLLLSIPFSALLESPMILCFSRQNLG